MRIYLYTLISSENQFAAVERPISRMFKNRVRRQIDMLRWRTSGRFDFHFHTYEDRINTNEGDIAIRLAVREQLAELFAEEAPEIIEIAWPDLDEAKAAEISAHGDLLVVAGGYFHYSPEGELKPPVPRDAELFECIQCPIVIYGAGANRRRTAGLVPGDDHLNERSGRILGRLLATVSRCAVRDEGTRRLLQKHGAANVEVVLDPAMLLRAPQGNGNQLSGIHVGLNFGFHGPHSEAILKRNIREYIAFAHALRRGVGCHFHYFLHSESEELVVKLLRNAGIDLNVIRGRAPALLDYYRRMTIQVSHMMHSTILSLAAGTPAISLAYDVKNIAFYQLMGLESYCLEAMSLSAGALEEMAMRLLGERTAVASAIDIRKTELAARNRKFLKSAAVLARQHAADRARIKSARDWHEQRTHSIPSH